MGKGSLRVSPIGWALVVLAVLAVALDVIDPGVGLVLTLVVVVALFLIAAGGMGRGGGIARRKAEVLAEGRRPRDWVGDDPAPVDSEAWARERERRG